MRAELGSACRNTPTQCCARKLQTTFRTRRKINLIRKLEYIFHILIELKWSIVSLCDSLLAEDEACGVRVASFHNGMTFGQMSMQYACGQYRSITLCCLFIIFAWVHPPLADRGYGTEMQNSFLQVPRREKNRIRHYIRLCTLWLGSLSISFLFADISILHWPNVKPLVRTHLAFSLRTSFSFPFLMVETGANVSNQSVGKKIHSIFSRSRLSSVFERKYVINTVWQLRSILLSTRSKFCLHTFGRQSVRIKWKNGNMRAPLVFACKLNREPRTVGHGPWRSWQPMWVCVRKQFIHSWARAELSELFLVELQMSKPYLLLAHSKSRGKWSPIKYRK